MDACLISSDSPCACRGQFSACLAAQGCTNANVIDASVAGCVREGCPASTCAPRLGDCSEVVLEGCADGVEKCMNAGGPDALCACHGKFDLCVYNAGCAAETLNAVVAGCEEAGCSAAVVRWGSLCASLSLWRVDSTRSCVSC